MTFLYWKRALINVDVSSLKEKLSGDSTTVTCTPAIYYSTKDRDSFTEPDYDVANTAIWSSMKPANFSTVTAIAVDWDASDGDSFLLKGKQAMEVYVTMLRHQTQP